MGSSCDSLYAEVILTLHVPKPYCYRVPRVLADKIAVGQSVAVQFGRKKIYSAIVVSLTDKIPVERQVKYILDIIDLFPILTPKQIDFFFWIASYYAAYIGDVLSAALPSAFRLKSETILELSPGFSGDISELSEEQRQIVEALSLHSKTSLEDLQDICSADRLIKIVSKLIKDDILIADEELRKQYVPKREICYSLCEDYAKDENKLRELFEQMDSKKSLKLQHHILLTYMSVLQGRPFVKKSELIERQCSLSSLNTLVKKGILCRQDVEISRLKELTMTKEPDDIVLNEEQQSAYEKILSSWDSVPVTLLYGVTGSGKTEVYIKLIDRVIKQGRQVLYLIPEIAITAQLITRLEKYFGNKIGVYNSRYSTMERAEVWQRTMDKNSERRFDIILGSRSAVFLPFENLGLVIVDEEHDPSFKQTEPVPHYNGKDCALYLAKMFSAKSILGSATPSIESYFHAQQGRYELVEMVHRYSKVLLPEIYVADVRQYTRQREMYGIFTKMLYEAVEQTLKEHRQIILFQNRRGYTPATKCNICGYVAKCPNCDVSLVYHKQSDKLICHYCGHTTNRLKECPECHSHSLRQAGVGTEKIEEELSIYFPGARVSRMDTDSIRNKDSLQAIVKDFSNGETDILAGTQIVTKGLDFDNVGLVGVIDADAMLFYPDFRAYERAFQVLTQVSGRAGRRQQRGKVIIQTYDPYNQVIRDVCEHNYNSMYNSQIAERRQLNFPPFCRMIKIDLQHRDRVFLDSKATEYALRLRQIFGGRLFGPQEPPIARIKNLYHRVLWLKIERDISYVLAKQKLIELDEEFLSVKENSAIRVYIDVDPV